MFYMDQELQLLDCCARPQCCSKEHPSAAGSSAHTDSTPCGLVSFLFFHLGRFPQSRSDQSEKPNLSAPEEQSQLVPQLCKCTWQKASRATGQSPGFTDR